MKKFLTISLLLISVSLSAQKGFVHGYVVNSSNDTLRGFIGDQTDWSRPYIEFTRTSATDASKLQFDKIRMFYLIDYDAYYYITEVDIDKKPRRTDQLETVPGRKIVKDIVALHLLAKGTINLYDYTDESGKQHYFVQKDGKIQELDYVVYKSGISIGELPFYTETLKQFTSDCDKVSLKHPGYNRSWFTKVINQYNSCFSTAATKSYTAENVSSKLRIGLAVGTGPSSISFSGHNLNPSKNTGAVTSTFSGASSTFIALNLELASTREIARFIPGFDITYQKTGSFTASSSNPITKTDLTTNFSFVNTGVNGKFIFNPKNELKAYLKVAASLAFVVDSKATYKSTNIYSHVVTNGDIADPKQMGFSLSGGAGVAYKRLYLEVNYFDNIVTTKEDPHASISTVNVMLGFRFLN